MQATQSLRFSRKDPKQFFKTLNQRVNKYFKEKKFIKLVTGSSMPKQ